MTHYFRLEDRGLAFVSHFHVPEKAPLGIRIQWESNLEFEDLLSDPRTRITARIGWDPPSKDFGSSDHRTGLLPVTFLLHCFEGLGKGAILALLEIRLAEFSRIVSGGWTYL